MTLEQQVTSLEISKRLKELGVKQESVYWWSGISNMSIWCDHTKNDMPHQETRFTWISAFTVAELGEMLPPTTVFFQEMNNGQNYACKNEWATTWGDTEANARGKMLIYLLENKLI